MKIPIVVIEYIFFLFFFFFFFLVLLSFFIEELESMGRCKVRITKEKRRSLL